MPEIIRKYEAHYAAAFSNLEKLVAYIEKMPEPDSGLVTWQHVGDLCEINLSLQHLLLSLGKEYK